MRRSTRRPALSPRSSQPRAVRRRLALHDLVQLRGEHELRRGERHHHADGRQGHAHHHLGRARQYPLGTALGSTQLDATASVPGSFAYTPACRHRPAGGPGPGLVDDLHPDRHDRLHHRNRHDDHQRADADGHLQRALRADDYLRHRHDHALGDDHRRHAHSDRQRRDHPERRDRECARSTRRPALSPSVFTTSALGVGASPYTISYSYAGSTSFAPASTSPTLTVNQGHAHGHLGHARQYHLRHGAGLGAARRHGLGAGLVHLYAARRHRPCRRARARSCRRPSLRPTRPITPPHPARRPSTC